MAKDTSYNGWLFRIFSKNEKTTEAAIKILSKYLPTSQIFVSHDKSVIKTEFIPEKDHGIIEFIFFKLYNAKPRFNFDILFVEHISYSSPQEYLEYCDYSPKELLKWGKI